jgi:hypothetical protein
MTETIQAIEVANIKMICQRMIKCFNWNPVVGLASWNFTILGARVMQFVTVARNNKTTRAS